MSNFTETFTDASGTLLTAHTGDSGQKYVRNAATSVNSVISNAGRLRMDAATFYSCHHVVQNDGSTPWTITGQESRFEWDYVAKSGTLGNGPWFCQNTTTVDDYGVLTSGSVVYLYAGGPGGFVVLKQVSRSFTVDTTYKYAFQFGGRAKVMEWNGSSYDEVMSFNYFDKQPKIPSFFLLSFAGGNDDSTGVHLDNVAFTNPATISALDRQVVFHGNSRTKGSGVPYTDNWVYGTITDLSGNHAVGSNYFAQGRGHDGWTSSQLITDYPTSIQPMWGSGYGVRIYVWEEGINDALGSVSAASQISAIEAHILTVQADGAKFVYVTAPVSSLLTGPQKTILDTVSAHFRANAAALGIQVADVATNTHFDDVADASDATYYSDGTHYTAAGHALYVPYAGPAIKAAVTYTTTGTSGTITVNLPTPPNGSETFTLAASAGTITATSSGGSISANGTATVVVTPPAGATSFSYVASGAATITYTNGQGWTNPAATTYSLASAGSVRPSLHFATLASHNNN